MHVNLAALLCFASTLCGVTASMGHVRSSPEYGSMMAKRSPEAHAGHHDHQHSKDKSDKSGSGGSESGSGSGSEGGKTKSKLWGSCDPPPTGWSDDDFPPGHCSSSVLLDWCQKTDPSGEWTLSACYDADNSKIVCSYCDNSSGQIKFPSCATIEGKTAYCNCCGDSCTNDHPPGWKKPASIDPKCPNYKGNSPTSSPSSSPSGPPS